jgi:hypothetical protein
MSPHGSAGREIREGQLQAACPTSAEPHDGWEG